MTLIEVPVQQAVTDFQNEREHDVSASTFRDYKYTLRRFQEFCDQKDIEHMSDVNGYYLKQFRVMRQNEGIKKVTLKNNLSYMRVFLSWCEAAELVPSGLADKVVLPDLSDDDKVSDKVIGQTRVEDILDYLYKFEYATRRHATFQLMWHTCIRMGTVQALDVDDYHPRAQYVEVHHRPESETPLKNRGAAEREIQLNQEMCDVLDDYIEVHRTNVVDEYDRKPLFTTPSKRLYDSRLRNDVYRLTEPCQIGQECPHDRDPNDCEATVSGYQSKCPSSMSPHPLRRAAITYHLNQEYPKNKLSERANVSVSVLDKHYNKQTKREEREIRKQYLDKL